MEIIGRDPGGMGLAEEMGPRGSRKTWQLRWEALCMRRACLGDKMPHRAAFILFECPYSAALPNSLGVWLAAGTERPVRLKILICLGVPLPFVINVFYELTHGAPWPLSCFWKEQVPVFPENDSYLSRGHKLRIIRLVEESSEYLR